MKRDLKNGIFLPQHKEQAFARPLLRLKPPETVDVPIINPNGGAMLPIPRVGETVAESAMLARSKNNLNWVVAPVSGRLLRIERMAHPMLGSILCARIKVMESVSPLRTISHDPSAMSPDGVIQAARTACILDEVDGMPLYYKLQKAREDKILVVVADAIDDTPYISSALKTVAEFGEQACDGVGMVLKVLGGGRAVLGVYDSGDFDIASVTNNFGFIEVRTIKGGYPAWPRFYRQYCGERPCLRIGVQALRALSLAIREGRPQTETVITVTGDCVRTPTNVIVPTGVSVEYILESVGLRRDPEYVIIGDTMCGVLCDRLDIPVFPGIRGICAMTALPEVYPPQRCVSCGRCVDVCPKGLFPSEAVRMYQNGAAKQARHFGAKSCDGCGACSAVCPSGIDVSEIMLSLDEE